MNQVRNFLDAQHGEHYKVFNLCIERSYPPSRFYYRAATYPFYDHNPPPFNMMIRFCEDVDNWLNDNEENIVVIHCKAGKGRTGTMIATYLLYSKIVEDTLTACEFYAFQRTLNSKGVTIPSQTRYIFYFEKYLEALENSVHLDTSPSMITQISVFGFRHDLSKLYVKVISNCGIHETDPDQNAIIDMNVTMFASQLFISGDTKIEFWTTDSESPKFFVWMHTSFIGDQPALFFEKSEIDGASKSKSRKFLPEFAVQFKLEKVFKNHKTKDSSITENFVPTKPNYKKIMLIQLSQLSNNLILIKKRIEGKDFDQIEKSIITFVEEISKFLIETSDAHGIRLGDVEFLETELQDSADLIKIIDSILNLVKYITDHIQSVRDKEQLSNWKWTIRGLKLVVEQVLQSSGTEVLSDLVKSKGFGNHLKLDTTNESDQTLGSLESISFSQKNAEFQKKKTEYIENIKMLFDIIRSPFIPDEEKEIYTLYLSKSIQDLKSIKLTGDKEKQDLIQVVHIDEGNWIEGNISSTDLGVWDTDTTSEDIRDSTSSFDSLHTTQLVEESYAWEKTTVTSKSHSGALTENFGSCEVKENNDLSISDELTIPHIEESQIKKSSDTDSRQGETVKEGRYENSENATITGICNDVDTDNSPKEQEHQSDQNKSYVLIESEDHLLDECLPLQKIDNDEEQNKKDPHLVGQNSPNVDKEDDEVINAEDFKKIFKIAHPKVERTSLALGAQRSSLTE